MNEMDGATAAGGIVGVIGFLLVGVAAIAMTVIHIMIVVKAFKNEESPGLGILCLLICIACLIMGFVKGEAWGTKKLAVWYVITVVALIIGYALGFGGMFAAAATMDPESLNITVPE